MKKDLETVENLEKVQSKRKMSKGIVALAAIGIASSAFAGNSAWASSGDSFGQLLKTMINWFEGNLGKLLALFGFIGTFMIYLMTHKGSVLFIGIVISLIAGGMVGIVGKFYSAGQSAFTMS